MSSITSYILVNNNYLVKCLLLTGCAGFTAASFVAYKRCRYSRAVLLLMGAALSLRLVMIGLDPFLHDWDERFHALVAKNLLADYLRPLLRANPVLPYDYRSWSSNHVWLHKQPLFLWQMTLSMQVFGVNEVALRLPSAILGTLLLWPTYRLGKLIFSPAVGYHAALLTAFAYYQLELTTGWQSVDHSDVAFLAYVTASVWAYYESRQPLASRYWNLVIGLSAGGAVLCKWLPGLVVYAAWVVDVLVEKDRRRNAQEYLRATSATAITALVVLPWQVYCHFRFPLEQAFETRYAALHFGRVLEGKGGPWYFYLTQNMWYQYQWLVLLIGIGIALLLTGKETSKTGRPLLVTGGLMFVFYTLAATKMPSYTYVVSPGVLLLAALAWEKITGWLGRRFKNWGPLPAYAMLFLVLAVDLRPFSLLKHHTLRFATLQGQQERRLKIRRTEAYRRLDALVPAGHIIFNAPPLAEIEAMFYSNLNVYSWWPSEEEHRSLTRRGYHLAILPDHGQQKVPDFLRNGGAITIPFVFD